MQSDESYSKADRERISAIQEVINENVAPELRDEFSKFMQDFYVHSTAGPKDDYRFDSSPDLVRRFALSFVLNKKFKGNQKFSKYAVLNTARLFDFLDFEQIYLQLSEELQCRWIQAPEIINIEARYVHLKLSASIGVIDNYYLTDILTFDSAVSEVSMFMNGLRIDSETAGFSKELDFSYPSDDFMESLRYSRKALRSFSLLKDEIQLFFRIVYGEKVYLEIMERIFNDLLDVTPVQILTMFDNWSQWRHLPSDWIKEFLPEVKGPDVPWTEVF